jgi:tRNA threonylcarbamoyl adenosine modification protein YeaZ
MLLLAIEHSAATGSVAVFEDGRLMAERAWLCSSGFFSSLKELLAQCSLGVKDISQYVIDIGPGSYSALRSSLAAVCAASLPEKQPIYALKSSEVIAFEIINKYSASKVQVIGDARRQQIWSCVYQAQQGLPLAQTEIQLAPADNFSPVAGAMIVSPDWQRLKDKLEVISDIKTRLLQEAVIPKAVDLGRLAYQKICANIPGEPLIPIYLHAAVGDSLKRGS